MSKIESYPPGAFCWGELATTDTAGAKQFYTEMFGWSAVDNAVPGGVYTIFQVDGNDAGAMHAADAGVPTHWGVYFATANADESAAKVAPLGGKIIAGPFDVMDLGRMAVVQDPQGAVFCLWQAGRSIGAAHGGPLSQICWPELRTRDIAGSVAFYTALFGWTTKPDSGFESAQYAEWSNAGAPLGGLLPMREAEWQGVPPHWIIYVTVADCDERTAKASELGASVFVKPMDIPKVGRFSVIADPQGAALSLIQLQLTE